MEGIETAALLDVESLFDAVANELRAEGARVPRATYRVQLNRDFTFAQARALADYLDALGVSDLYASPFFRARPESMHGYDIVDHNSLSPAIGTPEELDALAARLRGLGMGMVLDFVPNHMGIGVRENAWWMDVLENGPSSLYAPFFDIAWKPLKPELENKVLLPILGDHFGRVLEQGELKVVYEGGAFFLRYYEHVLPVNPRTYRRVLEAMLPDLVERFGPEDDRVLELQSIITGLTHLPPRTESQRAKVVERRREKEILKRRLATLLSEQPAISVALDRSLEELNGTKGDARSFDGLAALLEEQAYRLSFWRVAAEEINYRRFFDINDLAAIRIEKPGVFAEAHRLLFRLLADGRVNGLRIDHPDGLWDPPGYFAALQRGLFLARCRARVVTKAVGTEERRAQRRQFARVEPLLAARWDAAVALDPALARPLYLVIEKILSRGETIPAEWHVHGTSGYDFASSVGGVFVDASNERAITATYERFTGQRAAFDQLVYEKKKLVLQTSLASELNMLAHMLDRLSERDRHSRDFTLGLLTGALREIIACFPVYRTYATETSTAPTEHDRIAVGRAIRAAILRNPAMDASVFRFVGSVLSLHVPSSIAEEDRPLWRQFVMRFQQLSGPVMAKGVEDTAFYVFNRLVSLNEVGGEPERFGLPLAQFHRENLARQRSWPDGLLATSTHDTKRSEDVRARISVLSELPAEWERALDAASRAASEFRVDVEGRLAPDPNEEYLLYQTLLGTLPFEPAGDEAHREYVERIVAYMRKATKEAKVNTSWVNAAPEYDAAIEAFVRGALAKGSPLLRELAPLARQVAFHGLWGALSQALLKLASPGVPDLYQGTELWDLSLVDPDNRRPVDYTLRRQLLATLRERAGDGATLARELVQSAPDGRIKLWVTHVALAARRRRPALFGARGTYSPINAAGPHAEHVVAFARRDDGGELLVVAPRLTAKLMKGRLDAPVGAVWTETTLPAEPGRFTNLFTGEELAAEEADGLGRLRLERVLRHFPVALLERSPRGRGGS